MKILSKGYLFSSRNERDEFYRNLILKNNLHTTHDCLTRINSSSIDSYKDIIFRGLLWGSSVKDVIATLGTPRYKVEKLNDLNDHLVLFFKREILQQRAIVQCHFLQNELYFVHVDFPQAFSHELRHISDAIYNKYALNKPTEIANHCLVDCYQNKLVIHNDVTLSISYISGTASIVKLLEKQMERKTVKHR